jgi:hypothetical protein
MLDLGPCFNFLPVSLGSWHEFCLLQSGSPLFITEEIMIIWFYPFPCCCAHDIVAALLLYDVCPFWPFPFLLCKVVTSCNSTKDELVQEVESFNQRKSATAPEPEVAKDDESCRDPLFQYVSHVRTYPTFMFGGSVGSRVATVAFLRKWSLSFFLHEFRSLVNGFVAVCE